MNQAFGLKAVRRIPRPAVSAGSVLGLPFHL